MFNKEYYEAKKLRLNEKIQKLQNDTFASYLQISAKFFEQKQEMLTEIDEINQITERKNMSDESPAVETPVEGAQEAPAESEAAE